MPNNRLRSSVGITCLLVITILLTVVTSSFAAKKKDKQKEYVLTEVELQSELMGYADRFASIITQAAEDFESLNPNSQARRFVLSDLVYSVSAVYMLAADTNPQVAMLDMVTVTTLGRMIYEDNLVRKYGDSIEVLVGGFRHLESDIWQIAAKVLNAEQQTELRQLILLWRQQHPDMTVYNFLRFSDFAALPRESTLVRKAQAGGLFKSVQQVTQQVEETRMLAERSIFLSTRLLLLTGNFAEVWMSQLLVNPELNQTLSDVTRFAAVSERLATVAESFPDQISAERDRIIKQVSKEITQQRQAAITQAIKEMDTFTNKTLTNAMTQVAIERSAAIDQFMDRLVGEQKVALESLVAEEQRIGGLITEIRKTIEESDNLLQSATSLSKQINLDLSKSDEKQADTKPFDIIAYKDTIAEVSKLVESTNRLVATVGLENLLPELIRAIDQVGNEGEEIIDHSFRQALFLILIAMGAYIIARLLYNFLNKKLIESRP